MLCSADGKYQVSIMTKATAHWTGKVVWEPPAVFKSMCPIDVEWFPFDRQSCLLKFGTVDAKNKKSSTFFGTASSNLLL